MSIKEIINNEKWDAKVFDPVGKHNLAPYHNASLDRIEHAVYKRIGDLEKKLKNAEELKREAIGIAELEIKKNKTLCIAELEAKVARAKHGGEK